MADHKIHHFEQLLKELEDDRSRLNALMPAVFENLRRTYLLINEIYEEWCANVNTKH